MRYLCLVYCEPDAGAALSPEEGDRLTADSLDYDAELRERGYFLASAALQPVAAATTLRVRAGKLSATDGPFAETKEHLAGFILIEARDLNDALQAAARIPMARLGTVELRPVHELIRPDV